MSAIDKLTDSERAQVLRRQKAQADLPEYFSAELKTDIQISRDFEAFLILAPEDLKTSAIDWIQKAHSLQKANKVRDDLVKLGIQNETANATKIITALDEETQKFDEFRQTFQTQEAFSGVGEVQLFLRDLQRVIEERVVDRDRAFFDQVMAGVQDRFSNQSGLTDDQTEELQSWTAVLTTYLS
jgi:hypothetical protein